MANGIPDKGALLTRMSLFWFEMLADKFEHHVIDALDQSVPTELSPYMEQLRGRALICRKLKIVPVECVVRGYLAGSGWKEYQKTRSVCGVALPGGLRQCDKLPEPIFTPATKAEEGHDENICFEQACEIAGAELMTELRERSLAVYCRAAEFARNRGIIIADTKFEWGRDGERIVLADEVLTPDSSRFWPAEKYEPGRDQESFDKQYVRNYLEGLCARGEWDKTPPGPMLPEDIVANTSAKYREAWTRLTG
jgi:phosphoribosylaminoimidazole-succinocarboxamide synthase